MRTKILIAAAIGVTSALLCGNYSTSNASSGLAFKAKNDHILIPTVKVVRTIDSDLDGVTDNMDRCPDTPLGVIVNAYGCPVVPPGIQSTSVNLDIWDSDGDGIPDKYDCCPETPAGTIVDGCGCPI